jgi:hypothetical protein
MEKILGDRIDDEGGPHTREAPTKAKEGRCEGAKPYGRRGYGSLNWGRRKGLRLCFHFGLGLCIGAAAAILGLRRASFSPSYHSETNV